MDAFVYYDWVPSPQTAAALSRMPPLVALATTNCCPASVADRNADPETSVFFPLERDYRERERENERTAFRTVELGALPELQQEGNVIAH